MDHVHAKQTVPGRVTDSRTEQGREHTEVEDGPAPLAKSQCQQAREVVDVLQGNAERVEHFGADRPDRKIQHHKNRRAECEIVVLQSPVLRSSPALLLHEVRVQQIRDRTADRTDQRHDDQQGAVLPALFRDIEQQHTLRRCNRVGPAPQRNANHRHAEHAEEYVEDHLHVPVGPTEKKQRRHADPENRPDPGRTHADQARGRFSRALDHVGAVEVHEHEPDDTDEPRQPRMQPFEAGHNTLAVLVAQLVLGDDGNERETDEQGDDHRPHQAVAVVTAGDRRVNQIAGAEPGQRDDQTRTH